MNRNGNLYTFIYASVMVILVAALLSYLAISLKPYQTRNVEIEKKQNILASVNITTTAIDAEKVYAEKIVSTYVVNSKGEVQEGVDAFSIDMKKERSKPVEQRMLPVYEANFGDDGIKYVLPLYGAGLWGPIWGYIALNADMNTVYGATFDHQGETPGLGAEIKTTEFQQVFKGKTIFNEKGELVSIIVAKAGENAPAEHRVDAISGGTITSKGLQKMLADDLSAYTEFFNKKKN